MSRRRGRGRFRRWAKDRRFWLALAITAATLSLAFRDVPLRALARDLARANLLVLAAFSLPPYLVMVYLRALRWGHLTDAVCPIPRGALFRATAVGFLVNNLFPLRVGELVRTWYLAREVRAEGASILGTVILERVIDSIVVVGLALTLLGTRSGSGGGATALRVGVPLVGAAAAPAFAVVLLRVAPERTIGWVSRLVGPFLPQRVREGLERLLRRMAAGFGSLQGGRHLLWVALHSMVIWLGLSVLPFLGGMLALGLDLGSPLRMVRASYVVLAAVGVAVALPSAPGFLGPYHLACRVALTPFGVSEPEALAFGTLAHLAFWVTTTGLGLVALRAGRGRLEELAEAAAEPEMEGGERRAASSAPGAPAGKAAPDGRR